MNAPIESAIAGPASPPAFAAPTAVCRWLASTLQDQGPTSFVTFICDKEAPGEVECLVDVSARNLPEAALRLGGRRFGNGLALTVRLSPEFRCESQARQGFNGRYCSCCIGAQS
jgi:hypothetical protein